MSGPEVEALLELWGQEEALQDPWARRRNAEIFGWMARALAEHGHPLRTFEQVWSKVKELWLSCVRAGECLGAGPHSCPYYSQLHCILVDEEETSSMIVDTGLGSPVIAHPEQEHKREGQPAAPAEDEETSPIITLSLEPLPGSQEVSQASSEAGEGSSAGSEGPASPPMPPARVWGTQRCARPWDQLMWQ